MVLGIETSDDFVGVGIADMTGILISRAAEPEQRNKNLLHGFMEDALMVAGKTFSDMDAVSVSLGPGSFTGLRVGLAAAKGICWSRNIPLAGIPSTEAIMETARGAAGKFLAVKDARRNEFYYGGFESDGSKDRRIIADKVGTLDDILALLSQGFKIIGRRNQLEKSGISDEYILEYNPDDLGGIIALLGRNRLNEGQKIDVASAAPQYIRYPGVGKAGR
jgi:tRNA threonylcarbamoyladenosine biosynthesis protein TsaB